MKLEKLRIKNFKSIVDLELVNPSPFSVFVGPNGAGKSNIFEALEIAANSKSDDWRRLFGKKDELISYFSKDDFFEVIFKVEKRKSFTKRIEFPNDGVTQVRNKSSRGNEDESLRGEFNNFWLQRFSRIFVGNTRLVKLHFQDDLSLSLDAANFKKVLKRIFQDGRKKDEFFEWVSLFVPEFENIEIHYDNISGVDTFLIYEKFSRKPFTSNLISDGTINIFALLTAVFQSDEPQFLCIEEPENGLNPKVIKELVNFFRDACEEKGHYIWLNTHSQTLVSQLREEELILVDKIEGSTKIKQFKSGDFYGLRADEAWFTNVLGGGLPW
ncbi:MAG: AAA family ATPase [Cytophagaceae bacterium]|nr:AAA family ATPase [Cytophagaceae bacterium]